MAGPFDHRLGLDASDTGARVRATAFALLLTERRAIDPEALTTLVGMPQADLQPLLAALSSGGWLDRDPAGRVTGSAGLSLTGGSHGLLIGDARFRTWCAYDALGIAAALGADATIETACPVCDQRMDLRADAGRPAAGRPERLWLAEGGIDLRADFCTPTVLLCSAEHTAIWSARHGGRGRSVDLVEGAALGAEAWAGCAAAVAALSEPPQ